MNTNNSYFNSMVANTYINEKNNIAAIRKTLNDNNIILPDNIGIYDIEQNKIRKELYAELNDEIKYTNTYSPHNTYFKYYISGFECISDISEHDISRLMMLATYISHDNYLTKDNSNVFLEKSDLVRILNLTERTFRRTFNELVEHGYLSGDDNGFSVNSDVFHYGKDCFRPLAEKERYTKMYKMAIRSVYNTLKPSQHKILGYMFKLVPYANAEHWVLCKNPLEMNKSKIIPLTLNEICEIINYSKNNCRRLRNEINKIVFTYKGKNQRFMMSTITSDNEEIVTINPNIVFGGNPSKRDRKISEYFELIEKWNDNRIKNSKQ